MTTQSSLTPVRNNEFYIDTITFHVENELYKVLREPFVTNSQVFQDMLSMPQSGSSTEGQLDSNPIVLQGVRKLHFQVVLRLLNKQTPAPYVLPLSDWITILELSRTWLMSDVHAIAHQTIRSHQELQGFVHKIELARKYNLSDIFVIACRELITREVPSITYEEAAALGLQQLILLVGLRDQRFIRRRPWDIANDRSSYYNRNTYNDDITVEEEVRETFKEEIQRMETNYNNLFVVQDDIHAL
jgi:hypothetical protein